MRLQALGIQKRFPGVLALAGVDLGVEAGEVLAVVGENGAGKSTLMKILAGILPPDAGSIQVEGQSLRFSGVQDAQAAGVALIHQELCLCERLDIGANVCLGRETRRFGLLDRNRNEERGRRALERVGLELDLSTPVEALAIGQRQMVEIAKAVEAEARVLIMDEPTSSLSLLETERLFSLVEELAAEGTSVVYISHRLGEVERLADRALVLRDGEVAGELSRENIDHQSLVRLMVGREISRLFVRREEEEDLCDRSDQVAAADRAQRSERVLLQVENLVTWAYPGRAVDLSVREGEIVGIAGLVGAGRSELLRALFLVDPPLEGEVTVDGIALDISADTPADALAAGLALVPEDRMEQGLFLPASVRRNLSIARLRADARAGLVNVPAERALSARAIRSTGIRTSGDSEPVSLLSGGNQQKVVLGRAFAIEPKVLLLDEPTRGVDVGAKAEIYGLIEAHARGGGGVLFASSEMEEILGLADRCIVLCEGRIAGELGRAELSEEAVMLLATGGERAA